MAKAPISNSSKNPGMTLVITYGVMFAINAAVLFFANMFFPTAIVLGTHSLTLFWALFLSMGELALLNTFALPFIHAYENSRGKMFTSMEWMVAYFLLNAVGIWIITRFSETFGLGISSWFIAVLLALVLDVLQGGAMMALQKHLTTQ